MEWVRDFYAKQYDWFDWRRRWADLDVRDPGLVAHVNAVGRLAGSGRKRIVELGSGTGQTAAALAHAGHDVTAIDLQEELIDHTRRLGRDVRSGSLEAIAGDFYEVELRGRFDVVAYFDGFGIGSDDDQRRLLSRIAGWLAPDGVALIDVLTPWFWIRSAGEEGEFPEGSGVRYREGFDLEGSRMVDEMWRAGREDEAVVQSLRCYAPADLRLLLGGSGLALGGFEAYGDQWYEQPCSLDDAMLYLAKLVPFDE